MKTWNCIDCDWVNYDVRVRCRNCHANRAAFHPDPEIDDQVWRDWQLATDWNLAHGLDAEPLPGGDS